PYPDSHAFAIDAVRQKLASSRQNRGFHTCPRVRIDQQSHTTSAARAAHLARQGALPPRSGDDAVDHRRGDGGQIPPPKLPFLPDEPPSFLPVISTERNKEAPRYVRDARQIAKNPLIASSMPREDFPVVDAVLFRLPGIAKDEPPLEFVQVAADFLAPFASRLEMNRAGPAKRRRIM